MSTPARRRERPSLEFMRLQCENWNRKHPVGTEVTVEKDDGQIVATKTNTEAYMLSGHTAVIHLQGISGCYLLSRVRAKGEAE